MFPPTHVEFHAYFVFTLQLDLTTAGSKKIEHLKFPLRKYFKTKKMFKIRAT